MYEDRSASISLDSVGLFTPDHIVCIRIRESAPAHANFRNGSVIFDHDCLSFLTIASIKRCTHYYEVFESGKGTMFSPFCALDFELSVATSIDLG
jgi:hypothetical protein